MPFFDMATIEGRRAARESAERDQATWVYVKREFCPWTDALIRDVTAECLKLDDVARRAYVEHVRWMVWNLRDPVTLAAILKNKTSPGEAATAGTIA